jgi:SAM-dependent methyltransferase
MLKLLTKLYKDHFKYGGVKGITRLTLALPMKKFGFLYSHLGFKEHYCPCCGWKGKGFLPYIAGGYVTFRALCPKCSWHARHRGHILFYYRIFKITERKGKLLYFAPELSILQQLKSNTRLEIYTSEYESDTGDFKIDLMDIQFEDNMWDFIICHRVIEHIPDDRKGMRELYRILKPGGLLILSVPIDQSREKTTGYGFPNPLEDHHYYSYGRDFEQRIPVEFKVTRYLFSELFTAEEFSQMSLMEDCIFVCEKNQSGDKELTEK